MMSGAGTVGGEALGERLWMAVDVGGRGGEARVVGDGVGPDLVPDGVDAGHFHVLHVADEVAFGAGEVHLHFFVVEVDLVGDTVLSAPDALRFEEAVAEHLGEDVVVVALGAKFGVGESGGRDRHDHRGAVVQLRGRAGAVRRRLAS